MRRFSCPRCGGSVAFEEFVCSSCQLALGYDPDLADVAAVDEVHARCANHTRAGCNWLLPSSDVGALCVSCRLTRTRPNDADLASSEEFKSTYVATEGAKRHLVAELMTLGLPGVGPVSVPVEEKAAGEVAAGGGSGVDAPAFDLLLSADQPVTIGHADGVVTIDVAESRADHREHVRLELGEDYRTMLGHMRHEIGHFYWPILVESQPKQLAAFRVLFGDDRADYGAAIDAHYSRGGPPEGWEETHISAYATMHPWEDWAESFAHYLLIRDTLDSSCEYGLITDPAPAGPGSPDHRVADQYGGSFTAIVAAWVPLADALNAVNRSLGHPDAYPFVLTPGVVAKLAFVHARITTLHAG